MHSMNISVHVESNNVLEKLVTYVVFGKYISANHLKEVEP